MGHAQQRKNASSGRNTQQPRFFAPFVLGVIGGILTRMCAKVRSSDGCILDADVRDSMYLSAGPPSFR